MPVYSTVSVRIDENIKREATLVLREIGLTPAAAFRMMMRRIAATNEIPFDLLIPNAETVEALEAGRGDDVRYGRRVIRISQL